MNNPAPGRWVVSPDPDAQGPFTFDAIGANRPPVIDHVSAVGTADRVEVAYSVADVDDAATVSLFYDTNRDGFNGHLIAQGLSESVNGTYIWNPALDRVPSGESTSTPSWKTEPMRRPAATRTAGSRLWIRGHRRHPGT